MPSQLAMIYAMLLQHVLGRHMLTDEQCQVVRGIVFNYLENPHFRPHPPPITPTLAAHSPPPPCITYALESLASHLPIYCRHKVGGQVMKGRSLRASTVVLQTCVDPFQGSAPPAQQQNDANLQCTPMCIFGRL